MSSVINSVLTADLFFNKTCSAICGPYCLNNSFKVNSFLSEKYNWKRVCGFLSSMKKRVKYNLDDNKLFFLLYTLSKHSVSLFFFYIKIKKP